MAEAAVPQTDYATHVHSRQSLFTPGAFCEVRRAAAAVAALRESHIMVFAAKRSRRCAATAPQDVTFCTAAALTRRAVAARARRYRGRRRRDSAARGACCLAAARAARRAFDATAIHCLREPRTTPCAAEPRRPVPSRHRCRRYIGTVSLGGKRALIDVICTEFVEEDGTPVVERVVKTRLRPLPPTLAEPRPLSSYTPGEPVDVRSNDCWWEATVLSPDEAAAPPAPPAAPYAFPFGDLALPYAPAPIAEPAAPLADAAGGLRVRVNLSREVMVMTTASEVRPGMSWSSRRGWRPRSALDDAIRAAGTDTAVFDFAEGALGGGGGEDEEEDEGDGAPARSSKRAKRSRVTMVNGFSVLRLNNYALTGGEPSVFDRELGGAAEWDAPVERAAPRPKKRGRKAGAGAMRQHAPPSTEEAARHAHNKKIDIARATLVPRRAAFLESHLSVLEPFVTPAVVAQIRRFAAAAPKAAKAPARVPVKVPQQVNATLRPHQAEGLRWLSHMFHSGVNAILADEMVRTLSLYTASCCLSLTCLPPCRAWARRCRPLRCLRTSSLTETLPGRTWLFARCRC